MKKLLSLSILLGLAVGFVSGPASAEDKAKDELVYSARAVAGAQGVGESAASSKFFEYRDVPNGFIFNAFDLSLSKGNRYLNFSAEHIRQRDGRYSLSAGSHGKFKAGFTWDKTPHRFSSFAQTLYVESPAPAAGPGIFAGTGIVYYGIANSIQSTVQGAATYADAKALFAPYLDGVHGFDLGLQRNKGILDLTYTPSVPLSLTFHAARETRKGNRAIGASFGLSNAVEMPEPIDFVTTDLNAKVEYSRKWGTVQAGYDVSLFDNRNQAMIWDNPYRLDDRTFDGAYRNGDATSRGQMALWPSNSAQKVFFNGVFKLMKHTKLSGAFSYGTSTQDEKLLPYTINSALAVPNVDNPALPYYEGALQAPREAAMAKARITTFDLSLNSRLFRASSFSAYLNAGYRYYDFGNRTEALEMPGFSVMDQVWDAIPVAIEPYSFMRSKAFADLSFNLFRNTSLKVGYATSRIERQIGHEVEEAAEDKSHENTFKVSMDSNLLDGILVRVSYLNSRRKRDLDATEVIYPTFNFKRYFEANRNRDAVNLLVGFSLVKNLDLELSYALGNDRYPTSDYGLKKDDFRVYSADLSYAPSKRMSIFGFYSHELYTGEQSSRQSGATYSTDPLNDWTGIFRDKVHTFGGGNSAMLIPDKLNFDISYSFSYVKGLSDLSSPPGGTPDVALNFTKGLDTTKLQVLKVHFLWKFTRRVSVVFGYWFEQYDLDDITRNDYRVNYILTGNGMYLGALEPGFQYHIGSLKFIYSW